MFTEIHFFNFSLGFISLCKVHRDVTSETIYWDAERKGRVVMRG